MKKLMKKSLILVVSLVLFAMVFAGGVGIKNNTTTAFAEVAPTETISVWDGAIGKTAPKEVDEGGKKYYAITNASELSWMSGVWAGFANPKDKGTGGIYANKTWKLMTDIDLDNKPWKSIGNGANNSEFVGTFDFNGHKIINLAMTQSVNVAGCASGAGLFTKIKNAKILNPNIHVSNIAIVKQGSYSGEKPNWGTNQPMINIGAVAGSAQNSFIGGEMNNPDLAGKGINITIDNMYVDINDSMTTNAGKHPGFYVGGIIGETGFGAHNTIGSEGDYDVAISVAINGIFGAKSNFADCGQRIGVGGIMGVAGSNKNASSKCYVGTKGTGSVDISVEFGPKAVVMAQGSPTGNLGFGGIWGNDFGSNSIVGGEKASATNVMVDYNMDGSPVVDNELLKDYVYGLNVFNLGNPDYSNIGGLFGVLAGNTKFPVASATQANVLVEAKSAIFNNGFQKSENPADRMKAKGYFCPGAVAMDASKVNFAVIGDNSRVTGVSDTDLDAAKVVGYSVAPHYDNLFTKIGINDNADFVKFENGKFTFDVDVPAGESIVDVYATLGTVTNTANTVEYTTVGTANVAFGESINIITATEANKPFVQAALAKIDTEVAKIKFDDYRLASQSAIKNIVINARNEAAKVTSQAEVEALDVAALLAKVSEISTHAQLTENEQVTVYVTMSEDGKLVTTTDKTLLGAYPLQVKWFDLSKYGMAQFANKIGADFDYTPTLLHAMLQLTEDKCLAEGQQMSDVFTASGNAGGMWITKFWGKATINVSYYVNKHYVAVAGMGLTADDIKLAQNDQVDLGLYTDANYWQREMAFPFANLENADVKKFDIVTFDLQYNFFDFGESKETVKPVDASKVKVYYGTNPDMTTDYELLTADETGKYTITVGDVGDYYIYVVDALMGGENVPTTFTMNPLVHKISAREFTEAEQLEYDKAQAIKALDELIASKTEADYDANDWAIMTNAIQECKDAIALATTREELDAAGYNDTVTYINSVKTLAQKLDAAKAAQIAKVDEAVAKLTESDYLAEDWTTITTLVQTAKDEINALTTVDDVEAYDLTALDTAIANVLTIAQKLEAAKAVKVEEIDTLFNTYKQADYRTAEWTTMTALKDAAIEEVNAMETLDAVNAYTTDALNTKLGAVKTDAELTAEEEAAKAQALKEAKTAKKQAIQNAFDALKQADYSEANWTVITTTVNNAKDAIDALTTIEDVNAYNAQEVIDTINATTKKADEKGCGTVGIGDTGMIAGMGLLIACVLVIAIIKRNSIKA